MADEVGHETHCFLFWEGLLKNQADFKMTKQFFLASLVSGFVLLNLIMYFGCSAQAYVPNQFSPCSEWVSLFVQQLRKSFFHADFEWPFSTHCKGIPGTTDLCSNWRSNSILFLFSFFFSLFCSSCINKAPLFVFKPAGHNAHVPREEMSVRGCKIPQRWTKGLKLEKNGHDFKYNPHFH